MNLPPEAAVAAAHGPLSGIVVADFSRVLAGPLASMMLADLGATVIKVERPGTGDDTRQWGPPYIGAMSTYFTSVNRNKQSVTLDLSLDADLALAHTLTERADVFLENFLPGKLGRYGLDAATAMKANPGLVYCSISGFGSGPGAALPGYDFVIQAVGGLMSITGAPDGTPTKVGTALVDVLTGLHASIGILAALRERDRSGIGQLVEVNLLSSLIASLVNQGAGYLNGAGVPGRLGNEHPSIAPYELLATLDAPLAVAVGNDRQFAAFTAELGCPELAEDSRFAINANRVAHRRELVAALEALLARDSATNWTARLNAVGVACGAVNDIGAAIALAEQLGLQPIAAFESNGSPTIATMASPLKLSATPVTYRHGPPGLGADSADIRTWLSAQPDDVKTL